MGYFSSLARLGGLVFFGWMARFFSMVFFPRLAHPFNEMQFIPLQCDRQYKNELDMIFFKNYLFGGIAF